VTDLPVIRLFTFRAARPGFDEILRSVLVADLRRQRGILECFSGRQGPEEAGPRIVASVWQDADSMVAAVGDSLGTFHPELMDETVDRGLQTLAVRIGRRFDVPAEPRILRVLHGRVRAGQLDEYVRDVEHGVEADARDRHGPTTLYLGEAGDDRFVTVSTWRSWSDIERATGGDVHRPRATRQPERLIDWDVQLYEIVPVD